MANGPEHVSCRELVRLASDYLERHLDAEQTSLVEEHLNFCLGCERYVDQMQEAIRLAGLLHEEGAVPADVRAALAEAFRTRRTT